MLDFIMHYFLCYSLYCNKYAILWLLLLFFNFRYINIALVQKKAITSKEKHDIVTLLGDGNTLLGIA